MELVVAGQCNEASPGRTQGEKYLHSCISPHLQKQGGSDELAGTVTSLSGWGVSHTMNWLVQCPVFRLGSFTNNELTGRATSLSGWGVSHTMNRLVESLVYQGGEFNIQCIGCYVACLSSWGVHNELDGAVQNHQQWFQSAV